MMLLQGLRIENFPCFTGRVGEKLRMMRCFLTVETDTFLWVAISDGASPLACLTHILWIVGMPALLSLAFLVWELEHTQR